VKSQSTREALKQVLAIAVYVFAAEALVMLILDRFPALGALGEAAVDGALLTLLLVPAFYFLVFRPFKREIHDRKEAEKELSDALQEAQQLNKTLVEAQEQLVSSEKMVSMGHLAAGVAHEINNPIGFVGSNVTSLRTYLDRLLRLLEAYEAAHDLIGADADRLAALEALRKEIDIDYLKADVNDLLGESMDGLNRVKGIIRDLKDFSRATDEVWEAADLNAELERTLNVVHNELKYHVTVVKNFAELPPVQCIAPQMNQVFLNLLVNAGQAIEVKGTVTVTTAVDGDFARVSIADTGCGMTEAQLKKAFEPFYTTKPRGKGTGLGLSVSSGIVQKHHGRIEVTSTPGVGSTFHVLVPFAQPEGGDPEVQEARSPGA
jgi:signal transduction histidine kinase